MMRTALETEEDRCMYAFGAGLASETDQFKKVCTTETKLACAQTTDQTRPVAVHRAHIAPLSPRTEPGTAVLGNHMAHNLSEACGVLIAVRVSTYDTVLLLCPPEQHMTTTS